MKLEDLTNIVKKSLWNLIKKQNELDEFMKFISPIIENYIIEKSITIVLNKKIYLLLVKNMT